MIEQQAELDDSEPTPERREQLERKYEKNVAAGTAPYAKVWIQTRSELQWVMQQRKWSGDFHLEKGMARADFREAIFYRTILRGVALREANLSHADLKRTNLVYTNLRDADLSGADLRWAVMDVVTFLRGARLDRQTRLGDVVWNGVPLTQVDWAQMPRLGDEQVAWEWKPEAFTLPEAFTPPEGKPSRKDVRTARSRYDTDVRAQRSKHDAEQARARLEVFGAAARANRQVATVLRSQGLNEHADRFAYRAQLCQRRLLRMQRHYLRYLGSGVLGLISGYGYRPLRSLATYGLVIIGFMLVYMGFGVVDASCAITGMSATGSLLVTCSPAHTLTLQEALVFSLTSFHGRGFFPGGLGLGSPSTLIAAIEAVIGLVIEITFIATFTQRFFAR